MMTTARARRLMMILGAACAAVLWLAPAAPSAAASGDSVQATPRLDPSTAQSLPRQVAMANPCNPCGMKNPCNPCGRKNPCNPCGKKNPCNPCGMKNPCNPCGMKNPCNPCGANPCNPCGGGGGVDPALFQQPDGVKLAKASSALIAQGKRLWNDSSLGKTGLACASCHMNQYGQMKPSFAKPYPHYVTMPHVQAGVSEVNAAEMVNFCMLVPMGTDPLSWDSKELAALSAFVEDIQPGYKHVATAGGNPCNPCGMKNPCNPCGMKNPCNPCGKGHSHKY